MEKKKALEMALSQIEKQFGKGSIMILGSESRANIAVISTGSAVAGYRSGSRRVAQRESYRNISARSLPAKLL
jgi:hypothetical protein